MTTLIGTASWTDPSLIGCRRFYPAGVTSPEARLRHYASLFPIVEVDSSYYAMPSALNARRWVERTPDRFVMNVKAFRLFTGHATSPAVLDADIRQVWSGMHTGGEVRYPDVPEEIANELWRRFREALAPLREAGKLGLVHFQYPPWIVNDADGRRHVAHCVERMAGHEVSIEFRHRSWFGGRRTDETLAWERDLGAVHTVVDEPQRSSNSVPAVWAATHPTLALARLHGRNATTWNIRGARASSDRFDYDYSDEELNGLADDLGHRLPAATLRHVIFNNNREDQSQRNARTLMAMVERDRSPS